MALYITGDTHGDFRRFLPERFPEQEHLTKEDMVLICGDFGGVWYGDSQDGEGLDFLEARPITRTMMPWIPIRWSGGTAERSGASGPLCSCWSGARYSNLEASACSPWGERAAMISRTAS